MKPRRRGHSYVYFMVMSVLVMVIGLSALMAARVGNFSARGTWEMTAARAHARSAIELGCAMIHRDSNWRTSLGSGTWFSDKPIASGTMTLNVAIAQDFDGKEVVTMVATGVQGMARFRIETVFQALSLSGGLVVKDQSWQRIGG